MDVDCTTSLKRAMYGPDKLFIFIGDRCIKLDPGTVCWIAEDRTKSYRWLEYFFRSNFGLDPREVSFGAYLRGTMRMMLCCSSRLIEWETLRASDEMLLVVDQYLSSRTRSLGLHIGEARVSGYFKCCQLGLFNDIDQVFIP